MHLPSVSHVLPFKGTFHQLCKPKGWFPLLSSRTLVADSILEKTLS